MRNLGNGVCRRIGNRSGGGPFLEHRPPILEKNEQVRRAVEVDVDDLACESARNRVERFAQVRAVVEVPVQLAPDEYAADIVLAFVRPAVEVPIDGISNKLIADVVEPPEIRPAV